MMNDLIRLLDHLMLNKAHAVGFSMGGGIVARLVTRHPDRLMTASIIASDLRFRWTPEDARQAEVERIEDARARDKACATAHITRDCAYAMRTLGLVNTRQDTVLPQSSIAPAAVALFGIVGDDDPNVRPMRELKALNPSMTYVELQGATHFGERGILGRSETVTELRKFLSTHSN